MLYLHFLLVLYRNYFIPNISILISFMIKRSFLLLFIASTFYVNGQNVNIQNEILNDTASKSEIIFKSRRLLLDKFIEGDFEKVKRIKDYLKNEVENQDYITLYPIEYWLILYWTRDYKGILEDIQHLSGDEKNIAIQRVEPPKDNLMNRLIGKSRESYLLLNASLNHSELDSMDKEFLGLNLRFLLSETNNETNQEFAQDTLNRLSTSFLLTYPQSDYNTFTRKYIRNQYEPSNWGIGFEFFGGYGILTKTLPNQYSNPVLWGIDFDIQYKKYIFYLHGLLGHGDTRKEVSYGTSLWEKGSQYELLLPEASVGYSILENNRFKVTPFAGISSTSFIASSADIDKHPELKSVERSSMSYTLGFNTDIKMGSRNFINGYGIYEQSYWFIRLRYAYIYPNFESKYSGMSGRFHYFTLGIGILARKIKRVD